MRVVFDTNVFVSALAIPGAVAERALERVIDDRDSLIYSQSILHELLDVMSRKFARDAEQLARVAVFLDEIGECVEPGERIDRLRDEADNRILKCALAGRADAIVTGDREMLRLGAFRGIRIVTLGEYVAS